MESVPIEKVEYDENNGVLEVAHLQDDGSISPTGWGVECTNWHSFFSQEQMGGLKVQPEKASFCCGDEGVEGRIKINFVKGEYIVKIMEYLSKGLLYRRYRMTALKRSLFGDFVLRSRFGAKPGDGIIIGDNIFEHKGSNINYYYKPKETYISLRGKYWIRSKNIDLKCTSTTANLVKLVYYRDEPEHTRLHYRFLSADSPYLSFLGYVIPLEWINFGECAWLQPGLQNSFYMGRERHRNQRAHRYWQLVANSILEKGDHVEIEVVNEVMKNIEHDSQ